MRYVLITTPYSGANHFGTVFFNLLKQWHGCRGFVPLVRPYEYEITYTVRTFEIEYSDGDIITKNKKYYHKYPKPNECSSTLQYIMASPDHLVKFYPLYNDDSVENISNFKHFIDEFNYKVIYLERRNKMHQIISECKKSELNQNIKPILRSNIALNFINILDHYKKCKDIIPGKVIYYEDFVNAGQNEEAIIKLLDLERKEYIPELFEFNPVFLTEQDTNAAPSWIEHREEFLRKLEEIG